MPNSENPHVLQNNPGDSPRETNRVYRTVNDDNRRTVQHTPLSRTSSWVAVFLLGGWRVALAVMLIFFFLVNWVLFGNHISGANPAVTVAGLPVESTMLPTLTVAMTTAQVRVNGTGAAGLFLRKAPSRSAEVVKTLNDGTVLDIVGNNKTAEDVEWRNVRDSDGNEGWVSAGYVVPVN